MADSIDLANENSQRRLDAALASRAHLAASHATECDDCGDDIPDARRKAAPFARTCIECQGIRELKAKGVRR